MRLSLQVDSKQAPSVQGVMNNCTLPRRGLAGHTWTSMNMLQADAGMQRTQDVAQQASGVEYRGSLMFRHT